MKRPDLSLKITEKVKVHIKEKGAVISCETTDGNSVHMEASHKTLEKIHREIQKHLEKM